MSLEQDASILAKSSQASVDALGLPSDEFSEVSPTQEQVSETPAEPSFENLEAFQDADCKINGNAMASSMNDSSEVIPVEKNVFYNQETLKYMRIIDKYKRLDVADIELPRVKPLTGFRLCPVANYCSWSLRAHKALASPVYLKI